MADLGKQLYEIWVKRMLNNAIIVEEKWENMEQLEKQAWTETAKEFIGII